MGFSTLEVQEQTPDIAIGIIKIDAQSSQVELYADGFEEQMCVYQVPVESGLYIVVDALQDAPVIAKRMIDSALFDVVVVMGAVDVQSQSTQAAVNTLAAFSGQLGFPIVDGLIYSTPDSSLEPEEWAQAGKVLAKRTWRTVYNLRGIEYQSPNNF